jgi:hypothetical protein
MRIPAVLGAALLLLASGCGDRQLDGWTSQQSVRGALADADPIAPPAVESRTSALDATSQVAITVPRVYRVVLEGQVGRDGLNTDLAVGGWLLVVSPYAATGPAANDVNVVDIGLRTDTSPLDGQPGALWFGTHTSVMGDMDLGGVTPNAGPVDLVNEAVDGDLLVAQVITELAPTNPLNLFDVDEGGVLGSVLAGTVQLRFDADASQVVGRIDFIDPASGAEYYADLSGRATN